jgi:hypothetical protein
MSTGLLSTQGVKDVVKAFTILGTLVSIKALIDSQRPDDDKKEHTLILRRIEAALKSKGIID